MSSQTNGRSRPTFASLPREIITAISLQLPDRKSVRSLARASRAINWSCQPAIWREIDLSVPPHTSYRTEQAQVKTKLRGIIMSATRRRWGMVQRVKVDTRFGMVTGMVQLLENAQNLKELELFSPYDDSDDPPSLHLRDGDTLDIRWISSELSLPSLTHVTIGNSSIRFAEAIPLLCNSAPCLSSLIIDWTGDMREAPAQGGTLPCFPSFEGPTRIRDLRMTFWDYGVPTPSTAIELLRHCPKVRRVSLHDVNFTEIDLVGQCLAPLSDLEALSWHITTGQFWCLADRSLTSDVASFPSLRQLVLKGETWLSAFESIGDLPALEMLAFDASPSPALRCATPPPFPKVPEPERIVADDFVALLEECPRLRMITTIRDHVDDGAFGVFAAVDDIDDKGKAEGFIRSFRHGGGKELVHGRFLLDYYQMSDEVDPLPVEDNTMSTDIEMRYMVGEQKRVRTFERREKATWREYTEFDGELVPLEIIDQMRQIEGAGERDWEGRDIEVGQAAWKVLTDWVYGEDPSTDGEEGEDDDDDDEEEEGDEVTEDEGGANEGKEEDAGKKEGPAERTRSKSRASGVSEGGQN